MTPPKGLDLVTINKLIENNTKNLTRQEAALKYTLAEISFLEQNPAAGEALTRVRAKRDRQHANIQATRAYIEALIASKPAR